METEKQMITKYLKGMQIGGELVAELLAFREQYETDEAVKERISRREHSPLWSQGNRKECTL